MARAAHALSYTAYAVNMDSDTVTPIATATDTAWGDIPLPSASTLAIVPRAALVATISGRQ
jgi:hypothetical protein